MKALAAASGGAADDIGDGLNRRDLDVALGQWAERNNDSLTGGTANLGQLEKVGRLMMTIGSRLEAGDSGENDQMAIKRRVEAVWKLRRVCYQHLFMYSLFLFVICTAYCKAYPFSGVQGRTTFSEYVVNAVTTCTSWRKRSRKTINLYRCSMVLSRLCG